MTRLFTVEQLWMPARETTARMEVCVLRYQDHALSMNAGAPTASLADSVNSVSSADGFEN